ncbi:hypothetical protein KKF23_04920 [Patescibacteria group bacterium]|nr:hypothetical protein [Patescibacteria group bacterium]
MKEFFSSNYFLIISLLVLLLLALYREWEDDSLEKEIRKIFCDKKLKNGKKVSIRQPDIFLYYILQHSLNYLFRGIVLRHILDCYIVFPLTIILSLFLQYKYEVGSQSLILFITFMAILWYSKETFASRQQQKGQIKLQKEANEIAIGKPFVFVIKEADGNYVSIKNFGNNTAKNVIVDFLVNGVSEKIINIPVITPHGEEIKYEIEDRLSRLVDSENFNLSVSISYSDFHEKNSYITKFRPNKKVLIVPSKGGFEAISDEKIETKKRTR